MINPNKRMMVAPPMAQVVHTMLAQVLFAPPRLERKFARAKSERGECGDCDGRAERHGKCGGNARQEHALRQGKDENEDRASTRPEHDRHYFAPGDRPGKLPRIDHVVARLSRRVVMFIVVMVVMRPMTLMRVIVMIMIMIVAGNNEGLDSK
jgi:hypothetical protein